MHIVLLTPEFGGGTGGIGTSLSTLTKGLIQRGHRVTVVTRGPVDPAVRSPQYRLVRIPCPRGHLGRWAFRLISDAAAWSVRPDVVHAPEWGAVAAVLACSSRLPIVTRLDTPSFLVRELNRARPATPTEALVERAERLQARRSRLVLPASVALGSLVQRRWDLSPANVRVLRYAVDIPYLSERAGGSGPEAVPAGGIVFIGRLEARKGIDVLVPLLVEALEQTTTHVTVIGAPAGGAQQIGATLRQALARYGDRVSLVGGISHGQAMTLLARADLVLVPSVWDNTPMVVMEAMALGRCVVASAVGGIPELIDAGVTGFLVKGRNVDDWTRVVIPLLADERRRRAVGEQAATAATAWSLDTIAEHAEALYQEAIR
jgi:glycosyltransferase involved in cell wall biosynthesis